MNTNKKNISTPIKSIMIAPCGMNCSICAAHLREKKKCLGCRGDDKNKPIGCLNCKIKNCDELAKNKPKFCYMCKNFPCTRLKQLDKRYRTKYGMSMLSNLESIKELGIRAFVRNEKGRWRCSNCQGTICVHRDVCIHCGQNRR
ncbi:MAG: DUF3795 domain-containing protein [Chloroflexota bacterium]|nr:DUF3795 domain-containing protein [Chloroflexota bacterium]